MKAFKNILLATLMVITVLLLAYAIFTGGSDAAISWNLIWSYILMGGAVLVAVLGALWGIIQSPSGGKSSLASLILILIVIGAAYFIATGHEDPVQIKDIQNELSKLYNVTAFENAYALIDSEKAYTEAERAELLALLNDAKAFLGTNADFATAMSFDSTAGFTAAKALYDAIYSATDAAGVAVNVGVINDYEISGCKAEGYFTTPEYTWTEKEVQGYMSTVAKPVFPERNEQKYVSDDNMIVYETFENGKTFLLNFNDFRVVVELDGKFYTVEAYGYIVVKEAANA